MKYLQIFGLAIITCFTSSAVFANHLDKPAITHKVPPKGEIPKNQLAPRDPAPPPGEVNTEPPKNLYDEHYKASGG